MVRPWLELLTVLQVKDLVVVVEGFTGKHSRKNNMVSKSSLQRKELLRSSRDIASHIGPSGRVQPREEGGDFRPHLQLPQGFDPGTAEEQEDGQLCVFKKLSLEGLSVCPAMERYIVILSGIEKVPVQQCIHRVDTQCYSSYVTEYTPSTEVSHVQISKFQIIESAGGLQ